MADYLALAKPRILMMILLTVGVAMLAVPGGTPSLWLVLHAMIGTGFVAASASVLNQWYERDRDALMPRTAKRPLPDGRLTSWEASVLGWLLVVSGTLYLVCLAGYLPALIGLITWGLYVWVYTPMKVWSWWNTAVGTIPGALPVLMGWTAAGGRLDQWGGWWLTLVLVLWQFPHFMAIAWLYREQYGRAGYQMLSNVDPSGVAAAWHAIVPSLMLVPLSVVVMSPQSGLSLVLGLLAGVVALEQVRASFAFLRCRDRSHAKGLLRSSLMFLPFVLLLIVFRACLPAG
jgi:protoheme IX farnesyltransferase